MEDFVPTRASQTKRNYAFVNYEVPKRKILTDSLAEKQKMQKINPNMSAVKKSSVELRREQEKEMKKARYDVIKLAMSGFDKKKARKTKMELAIQLGAAPPKNKKTNYKKLKERRKTDAEKMKKEEHISGFTSSLLKPKLKKVRRKDSGILGVYGKVSNNTLPK